MDAENSGIFRQGLSGLVKLRNWLADIFSEYFFLSDRSSLSYRMFQLRMRSVSVRRIQSLLAVSAFLIVLNWPVDFSLFQTSEIIYKSAVWRGFTASSILAGVIGLQYSERLRKYVNLTYTSLLTFNVIHAGYLLGSIRGLDFPLFNFLVFIAPMYAIVLSVNVLKRFFVGSIFLFTLVFCYIYFSPESYSHHILLQYVPSWLNVVIVSTVIGHSIYYYDYTSFKSERKLQLKQQEIQHLASYDQLTSLLNRTEFNERAQRAFEEATRYENNFSLAMIDLDHFKKVNDNYGHPTGDLVLEKLGGLINDQTRSVDIAGRYGGEEFYIALPQTTAEQARQILKRLQKEFTLTTFQSETGEEFTVTLSIGLAELTDDIDTLDELIQNADRALYRAKDMGRNTLVVNEKTIEA